MDLSEIQRAISRGLNVLAAPPPMPLSRWAAEHFYLSAESSYVEQRWEAYPYQTAILDAMSNDDIREVVFIKSARVGYTKMILAAMGYYAHHKRRNQCVWQPTDDDSDEFVKTELEPMLRDVAAMAEVFPAFMQRSKDNTLRQKVFLGSTLHMRGGKAAKNYRRLSVDVGFLDELDGFDIDVEKEGSPPVLAAKRVEGATFPKMIYGSTPKLKGFSLVEGRADQAEKKFSFHVPCPHCSTEHVMRWGGKDKAYGFKWSGDDPETVQHICPSCGVGYSQSDYLTVWTLGRWIADDGTWIDHAGRFRNAAGQMVRAPLSAAFWIWTAYGPLAPWAQIVREFRSAWAKAKKGDKSELKTFVNTTLGETWEEDVEKTEHELLQARAEPYALRTLPMGVLVLTAGVDVQDDRFEIVVWGWGEGEESWVIDHVALQVNPAADDAWKTLDAYLQTTFRHAGGQMLGIEAVAIDTQGHYTHQVYNWVRHKDGRRFFGVRGDPAAGKPIKGKASRQDVNHKGTVIKRGVKLWHVGTDTAKDLLFGRLKLTEAGPGCVHFSTGLEEKFYLQLTAEVRIVQRGPRGDEFRWIKRRPRNEVLDCTVYAMFGAYALDLHRYTKPMWDQLRDRVAPRQGDLLGGPPIEEPVAVEVALDPVQEDEEPAAAEPQAEHDDNWLGDTDGWLSR